MDSLIDGGFRLLFWTQWVFYVNEGVVFLDPPWLLRQRAEQKIVVRQYVWSSCLKNFSNKKIEKEVGVFLCGYAQT